MAHRNFDAAYFRLPVKIIRRCKKVFLRILFRRYRISLANVSPDQLDIKITRVSLGASRDNYAVQVPFGRIVSGDMFVAVAANDQLVPRASSSRSYSDITAQDPLKENPVLSKDMILLPPFKTEGKLLTILTDYGGADNYYHWLIGVLPRIHIAEHVVELAEINSFLVPSQRYPYQIETLDMLLPARTRISSDIHKHIIADEIIATTHPCPDLNAVPEWVVSWLRERFVASDEESRFGPYVFISRNDANHRRLLNEDEIFDRILQPAGFQRYLTATMSFKDQVNLFAGAKMIVAVHGAGLSNLCFCSSDTKVLELFAAPWHLLMFQTISEIRGLHYEAIVSEAHDDNEVSLFTNFHVEPGQVAGVLAGWER